MNNSDDPPMGSKDFTEWIQHHRQHEIGIAWSPGSAPLNEFAPDALVAGFIDLGFTEHGARQEAGQIFALWPAMPITALADMVDTINTVLHFNADSHDTDLISTVVALVIRMHMRMGYATQQV